LLSDSDPPIHNDQDLLAYYLKHRDLEDPEWKLHDANACNNAREWINKNEWFEDYIFAAIQGIASEVGLSDISLSVEADQDDESYFEVDVVALRGYQLFVWSCTVESNKTVCKEKLLEVSIRAKQLGGDEARFALICFANVADITRLHQELGNLLNKDIYEVFGDVDLPNLATHIKRWIQTVDREVS
jgi:hypothetical protein